jgi:hypothetical protein
MIPIKHHKKALLLAQDLPSVPVLHAANSAYHQPTIAKLMAFHNATIGSIPVVTLCNDILSRINKQSNQKASPQIYFNHNGTRNTHLT